MNKIYIVLTRTGTFLSKLIKVYTKDEFTHSSISLDKALNQMYSFGRLNPYNPFYGGFVHEGIKWGTFKRFKKTEVAIYELEIPEDKYEKAKKIIEDIEKNKSKYSFNVIGLFLIAIKKKRVKENTFYCAEFVKHILNESEINTKWPDLIRPESFKSIEDKKLIYKGLLREYGV